MPLLQVHYARQAASRQLWTQLVIDLAASKTLANDGIA